MQDPPACAGWPRHSAQHRPRTAGDRGLYRPRQLGKQLCSRLRVWLHPAVGGDPVDHHAHRPAAQCGPPGHRHGPVPERGCREVLTSLGGQAYCDHGSTVEHIDLAGRDTGWCHRAADALRHTHRVGVDTHCGSCADTAIHQLLQENRARHHLLCVDDRALIHLRAVSRRHRLGRGHALCFCAQHSAGLAAHRDERAGRRGNAPQPVFAQRGGAEPRDKQAWRRAHKADAEI